MGFRKQLVWKIYNESGVFIETLNDVISDLSIEKQIFGGDSEFSFKLDRKMDDFDENTSIRFNNRVKVYLKDEYNPTGTKLIANGYIVTYSPYLKGREEGVEVTCLSAVSKLSNDFYRSGTAAAASDLGVELTNQRVDQMMQAIINHYRSVEANPMITNDFSNVSQTTDNNGNLFSFNHRFFNMKHLDSLREVTKFLPRNKLNGHWFYWRINTNGDLVLKNIASTAQHTFLIGKHITEISGEKTIEGVINRVYFWNEKGTVDPDYLKITVDDTTSQTNHDIIADYITDSKITNPIAASLLAESRVYDKKDPKVKIRVKLNEVYDLSSIEPGQTCQILNAKNNPYKVGHDTILIIQSIQYEIDSATLELSEAADNFEDIVEEERQRLDKEMTWFGFISQALTAAQLGPANRTWATDIRFTATIGANAYRQVDWSSGTVFIPTSASGSSGRRVIRAGNTGLMLAATDYFIYLDEEIFNTSAASSDSGIGTIQQGGDALFDNSKNWANDQYKGFIVTIGGQTKIIKSNTARVLTIEDRWTIADQTSAYTIRMMSFDVTNDRTTIASLTKVIFSNVRANSSLTSEAIINTTSGSSTPFNLNIDGSQIARRSISADEIIANTITSNEINTGSINIGSFSGTIDNILDGPNFRKTTANQVIGAGRAFLGFDVNNRIAIGFYNTSLSSISLPTNGVRIDANGIFGRSNNVTTFFLDTSGNAYFVGSITSSTITASTLTGGTVRTSSGTTRVELSGASNEIQIYHNNILRSKSHTQGWVYYNPSGTLVGEMYASSNNELLLASNLVSGGSLFYGVSSTGTHSMHVGTAGSTLRFFIGNTNSHIGDVNNLNYVFTVVGRCDIFNTLNVDGAITTNAGYNNNHITVNGNAFLRLKAMSGAVAGGLTGIQNGAMYYRTDDNAIRVLINGVWRTISVI